MIFYHLFKQIITVSEAGKGKEWPDIYLLTAKKLGVKPEDCIVFEDCLHAVKGAKKAGMKVWAVHDRFSAHEKQELETRADRYIYSFYELLGGEEHELYHADGRG